MARFVSISGDIVDTHIVELCKGDHTVKGNNDLSALIFVKMTISRETLPTMAEGVIYAHKRGFEVSCNLAYGIDWSDPDNVAILDRELHKLIDFYIANPQITPAQCYRWE